ncbi:hypothetical protein BDD12DRAFT_180873 [Trichophaea hybrida]|nr:hypothetical protein BDD12DRAFT_180873 [Trichophaea hybrida]
MVTCTKIQSGVRSPLHPSNPRRQLASIRSCASSRYRSHLLVCLPRCRDEASKPTLSHHQPRPSTTKRNTLLKSPVSPVVSHHLNQDPNPRPSPNYSP